MSKERVARNRARQRAGRAVLFLLPVSVLIAADPQFEVATVKPNLSGSAGSGGPGARNGRFTGQNNSLKTLISVAFAVPEFEVTGPDWLESQHFDVTATLPQGVQPDQIAPMLRALLEQRFHLQTHRETVEMSYYALIINKGGPKIKPIVPGEPLPPPPSPKGLAVQMTNGTVQDFGESLARHQVDRPVLDKTGLTGRYHIVITYATEHSTEPGPDIVTAIQEQLGLKLESQKGPIEVIKVDHADKTPVEN